MAVLELQQVKCPNCGANITSFSAFQAEVECPYCHQKAFNPLIVSKQVPIPERLIRFNTSEEDFSKSLVNSLVEQDYVPTDIFSCINPGNVIKAYLPMFLYEGKYQASWSCSVGYETTELRASSDGTKVKNKTVKKYQPASGTSSGNFAFLCLAYKGDDIPAELKNFTFTFPYSMRDSKEYDPSLLGLENDKELQTLAMNTDPELVWDEYGEELVNQLAEESAQQQVHGQDIKDFRVSSSYDLKTNGRYVLVPFWFVYYMYKGEKHYFLMDGLGKHNALSTPVNKEEVEEVKKHEKIKKWVSYGWILSIALLFAINLTVAIGYLVVWFIGKLITNKMMNNKIAGILASSKEIRRAEAARLL